MLHPNILRLALIGSVVVGLTVVGVHAQTEAVPAADPSPTIQVTATPESAPISTAASADEAQPPANPATTPNPAPTTTPAPTDTSTPASTIVTTTGNQPAPPAINPAPTREQLNDLYASIGAPGEKQDEKYAACLAWPLDASVCQSNETEPAF